MAEKSWHINRRTFLKGTGVALALPFLDCMRTPVHAAKSAGAGLPRRLARSTSPTGPAYLPKITRIASGDGFRPRRIRISLHEGTAVSGAAS